MQSIIDRVIIPVGGTDREFWAQEHAIHMAEAMGASVRAIHVAGAEPPAPDLFAHIQEVADRHGVELSTQMLSGDPASEIVAEAGPQDLIVLGTRRIQDRYKMGSVALAVAQLAQGPVQMVRLEA